MEETQEGTRQPFGIEQAAYGAIAVLAAGLRSFQLGLAPLSEPEAEQALSAYRFLHGVAHSAPAGTLPALFTGNVIGFTLLGAGDAAARWLPLVAGIVLVLLPYGLRHRLGRGGALAASLLLALSPSAVYTSRVLDGTGLAVTCGLALVVSLIRFADTHSRGALLGAAAALGIGLCAGPATMTLLSIVALFAIGLYSARRWLRREAGWQYVYDTWQAVRHGEGLVVQAIVALVAALGLVATTLALHPAGIGNVADLIAAWVLGFWPDPGGPPAVYPLLILLRYELLAVALGLAEIARSFVFGRKSVPPAANGLAPDVHTQLLSFWALAATLLIVIAGHRPAGNALLVVVPLALLGGQGIEGIWRWASRQAHWLTAGLVAAATVALVLFFYLELTAYALSNASPVVVAGLSLPTSTVHLLLILLVLVLLIGLGAAAWAWRGAATVVGGGGLALVLALSLWSFRACWSLNHSHAVDARELMIGQATAPDVKTMVQQLERLSLDTEGDPHVLPVTVESATGPIVAWYMRSFDSVTVVEEVAGPPETRAAVTLAQEGLPLGDNFTGQGFPLRTKWLPWGLGSQPFVRWLVFTEGTLPGVDQEVVLWVAR